MPRPTVRAAGTAFGYGLVGLVGTAVVGAATLLALQPLGRRFYTAVYWQLGPSDATKFATLVAFVLAGTVALAAVTLAGEYLSERGANRRPVFVGLGTMATIGLGFVAVSVAGVVGVVIALGWVLAVGIVVPLLLTVGYGVRSGGVPAFLGGLPVVVLLLLLASVGIGWGWGYVVTADEVPAASVRGEVVRFDTAPQVRDDLFTGECETRRGRRHCLLHLRGYTHELLATRFLATHGVRCPYQGTAESSGAFITRNDGRYYQVRCVAHGD